MGRCAALLATETDASRSHTVPRYSSVVCQCRCFCCVYIMFCRKGVAYLDNVTVYCVDKT